MDEERLARAWLVLDLGSHAPTLWPLLRAPLRQLLVAVADVTRRRCDHAHECSSPNRDSIDKGAKGDEAAVQLIASALRGVARPCVHLNETQASKSGTNDAEWHNSDSNDDAFRLHNAWARAAAADAPPLRSPPLPPPNLPLPMQSPQIAQAMTGRQSQKPTPCWRAPEA